MLDFLDQALELAERPEFVSGPLPPAPIERFSRRGLSHTTATSQERDYMPIEAFGDLFMGTARAYLADPNPEEMLLIQGPAGVGKSHWAAALAEEVALAGYHVLYAAPYRHFWSDIQKEQKRPQLWQMWHARSVGDDQAQPPKPATCRYEPQINAWMKRGHKALDFCSNARVCGWSYMASCPFHTQKEKAAPIIFGQHAHVALGHPLMAGFKLVIGDESPLGAFMRKWHIPTAAIVPPGMTSQPLYDLLSDIKQAALRAKESKETYKGTALYTSALPGGAGRVLEAIGDMLMADDLIEPEIESAEEAEDAPFGHIYALCALLRREALRVADGLDIIPRVRIDGTGLTLLLRHAPPPDLPKHVIWLDATGDADVYAAMFQRPVRVIRPQIKTIGTVYQMWASANNKSAVVGDGDAQERKRDEIRQHAMRIMAKHGYSNPAVVTYKDVKEEILPAVPNAHFGANRGTNALQGCDVLFVVGTPMPNPATIVETAAMLFFERDEPFNEEWYAQQRGFDGDAAGAAYSAASYWDDPDLRTVVAQYREAEIVQAVNRARPLRRQVDIWLLSNLPVPGLDVTLVSLPELFDAVDAQGRVITGIDIERWPFVLELDASEDLPLTVARIEQEMRVSNKTARRWFDALQQTGRYALRAGVKKGGRGRPNRELVRVYRSV